MRRNIRCTVFLIDSKFVLQCFSYRFRVIGVLLLDKSVVEEVALRQTMRPIFFHVVDIFDLFGCIFWGINCYFVVKHDITSTNTIVTTNRPVNDCVKIIKEIHTQSGMSNAVLKTQNLLTKFLYRH